MITEAIKRFLRRRKTLEEVWPEFYQSRIDRNLRPVTLQAYEYHRRWLWIRQICKEGNSERAKMCLVMVRWLKHSRYLPPAHPISNLPPKPLQDEKVIRFLTVPDAHAYLRAAPDKWRATFALALFAGLRPYECCRIRWSDIDFKGRTILVTPDVSKIRRKRLIEGIPAVIWPWLEAGRKELGTVCPVNRRITHCTHNSSWARKRRQVAAQSGVTLSQDVFRHTFATYHVALTGNPALTARVLGHSGIGMLAKHYDGITTKAEAKKYFNPKFKPNAPHRKRKRLAR